MGVGYQGRERGWDIVLDGVPYRVVSDQNGVPRWGVQSTPEISTKAPTLAEEEYPWHSWHGGFGYARDWHSDTYHYADGIDCRWPRQMIMGPLVSSIATPNATTVVGFFEQSGTLYVLASQYCHKVNTANHTFVTLDGGDGSTGKDFTAGKACTAAANFDGSTLVGMGNSEGAWTFTGSTWTQTGTSPDPNEVIYAGYFATYWAEIAYVLARTFTSSSDPCVSWLSQGAAIEAAPSNWGTAYDIGEDGHAITGMTAFDRTLFIGKTDGLYYLDRTGRTPRVIPTVYASPNNGVNVLADSSGQVWCPTVEGYYRYDPNDGVITDCSPGRGLPNESSIYGRVTAHVQHKGWRYVAVYNGTTSYIMCGREREGDEGGIGPYIWHGALYSVTGQITCMHISGITSPPELWFGVGTSVYYFRLPSTGDNPLQDTAYRYRTTTGSLYLPATEWNVPGTRWQLTGLEIENEGLTTTTYVDLYAKIGQGAWQLVQRADVAGRATIQIPMAEDWRFNRIAFRLDVTNPDSIATPKIHAIVGKAARRVSVRDLISTTVYCSDRVNSRLGVSTQLTGLDQLDHLKVLQTAGRVTCSDWWTGRQRDLTVLVMPIQESLVIQKGDDAADLTAQVTMAVLAGSGNPTSEQPNITALYDIAVYDSDAYV